MRKKDQEIFRRAVELAGSSSCKDWCDVQKNWWAPDLVNGEKIRTILDLQCGIRRNQGKRAQRRRWLFQSSSSGFAGKRYTALKSTRRAIVAHRCRA
jgi:hypothetical protein